MSTQRGQSSPYLEGRRNVKTYAVSLDGFVGTTSTSSPGETNDELSKINVYPNPVGGDRSNVVKLTNLPAQSVVTMYTLNGALVRQFQVEGMHQSEQNLDWDLKNIAGKEVSSGAYFIHVQAEGIGERTLKLIYVE